MFAKTKPVSDVPTRMWVVAAPPPSARRSQYPCRAACGCSEHQTRKFPTCPVDDTSQPGAKQGPAPSRLRFPLASIIRWVHRPLSGSSFASAMCRMVGGLALPSWRGRGGTDPYLCWCLWNRFLFVKHPCLMLTHNYYVLNNKCGIFINVAIPNIENCTFPCLQKEQVDHGRKTTVVDC